MLCILTSHHTAFLADTAFISITAQAHVAFHPLKVCMSTVTGQAKSKCDHFQL